LANLSENSTQTRELERFSFKAKHSWVYPDNRHWHHLLEDLDGMLKTIRELSAKVEALEKRHETQPYDEPYEPYDLG
jgi:hypothetical protein